MLLKKLRITMFFPDWKCPQCNEKVFGSRNKCRKCGCFRFKAYSSSSTKVNASPPVVHFKPGDWYCPTCNVLNFGKRDVCYKCMTSRVNENANASSTIDTTPPQGKPICSICLEKEDIVFTKCGHLVCCSSCTHQIDKLSNVSSKIRNR